MVLQNDTKQILKTLSQKVMLGFEKKLLKDTVEKWC
jgi:hypothetical protein